MKLEIDLMNEAQEKILADRTNVGKTIDLVISVVQACHSHSDYTDARKKQILDELMQLQDAINSLHMIWHTAYWLKRREETKPAGKGFYNYHFWNTEEKTHDPLFTLCTDHVTSCHIPPGKTLKRSGQLPLVGTCKFCELEAIANERVRKN